MNEVYDIGLPEVLDDGGVTLIEWGDAIMPSLPADFLEVRLDVRRRTTTSARSSCAPSGRSWSARNNALGRVLAEWLSPVERGSGLLILGIESSTVQVGAAVGGHEGVLAQAHSARGQASRREPHADDRLRPPASESRLPRDRMRRRRSRPRAVHRPARRHRVREGARARAARADDRGGESRPARVPGAVLAIG